MSEIAIPKFDQLLRMTDHRGTFEHACFDEPRPEHGYCTDDMARVLVVAAREPGASGEVNRLAGVAVRFLNDAQALGGACRNRMDAAGKWLDEPSLDDCWGRCIWGLGTAVAHSDVVWVRKSALVQFERAAQGRSKWPRAMAYAALGAVEVLTVHPDHRAARKLVTDYAVSIAKPNGNPDWPWPEPRLRYANAVLAEAIIGVGVALEAPKLWQQGLDLLAWLVDIETLNGHLSPTPVAGRGPGDPQPAFDQQPIEVAALADACARAAAVDAAAQWNDGVRNAVSWFTGANDAGQLMWDPATGGGYDGLLADGVNLNQGAESTLAMISTMQHGRRISLLQR
ncbi:glycosyltransferase [Mycolicibacterium aichiense]|nr:glycosyltransferase [Mycolicibacterium aichiense]MCV7016329.1 glycosyltransferase [Mycolicibacterium aichiense]STZ26435.1 glycosyltransferase, group I [Mycolicibacterium aichiense]